MARPFICGLPVFVCFVSLFDCLGLVQRPTRHRVDIIDGGALGSVQSGQVEHQLKNGSPPTVFPGLLPCVGYYL